MGRAASPPAAQPYPDARVGRNVAHVLRLFAEFRDEPELVPDELAAQGGPAGLARLASGRLEQRLRRQPAPQRGRPPLLEEVGHRSIGHATHFTPPVNGWAGRRRALASQDGLQRLLLSEPLALV